MSKKHISRITASIICVVLLCSVVVMVVGCNNDKISNENTPLVLASEALDGVFNPFFYTSGADGEIIGQTQVGLLSSDYNGNIVASWNDASVAFKYSVVRHGTRADSNGGTDFTNYYTDYFFAIKNNLKFSDGTALTMHDVLFNIYMFLDPAYTGSSTLYSVDIQGLKAYRAQTENEFEQGSNTFALLASARKNNILSWATNNRTNDWNNLDSVAKADVLKLHELFKEELEADWLSFADTGTSDEFIKYVDRNGNRLINEDWQVFLLNYGLLTISQDIQNEDGSWSYKADYGYEGADKGKTAILTYTYNYMVGDFEDAPKAYKDNLAMILEYYQSGSNLYNFILAQIMREELGGKLAVPSISGITVLKNQDSIVVDAQGNTEALLDKNGNPGTYEVLRVRINGEDPKAIQNLSVTVAPGHYYSTKALWDAALADTEYAANFGVSWSDSEFMNHVRTNQLPLGAGPYRAANKDSKVAKSKGEFLKDNIVYMIRNEHFMLGAPKIHKLRFKVVSSTQMYNEVVSGGVHYASPQAKKETVDKLTTTDKKKLSYALGDNLGYGYIGINAYFIHNIWIRRAIMTTLDPSLTVAYYGGSDYASVITRPMSKTLTNYYDNWETYVYTDPATGQKYSYAFDDKFKDENGNDRDIAALVYARDYGGCTVGSDGKLRDPDGNKLKYTFTVAGDTNDHPAYNMLTRSATILNAVGFEITVSKDSQALLKLSTGQLTVWAAAWSSSSDPDMYQVYHKNSSATSTKAWGYEYLTGNEVDYYQREIVDRLADLIDEGRETSIVDERKITYSNALDVLMELAVEYPTYQRKMLYVWAKGIFDESTLYTGDAVTAYRSPLSDIWNVSFMEG